MQPCHLRYIFFYNCNYYNKLYNLDWTLDWILDWQGFAYLRKVQCKITNLDKARYT